MHKTKMMYRFMQQENTPAKIYIYDDVTAQGPFNWDTWQYDESETSANHFVKLLNEIPDGGDIELHINSYGGDVKEGVAIYNLLKRKNCNKVCYIDCFAYSVAYVIAMACDKIIMGLGTSIMIHEMWTYAQGNAEELRKQANDLDVLMESNRQIFLKRCNLSEEQLITMMKEETILSPDKCLEYGFCDEIDTSVTANKSTIEQSYEKKLKQMSRELSGQQSLMEYVKMFVEQNHKAEPQQQQQNGNDEESGQQNNENKALKMLGAFFNAVTDVNIKK